MAKAKPIVGIDLGGTNMQIGVVDADGQIIGRSRKKTQAEKGQAAVIARIVESVEQACAEAGLTPKAVGGIGIGAPGAIEPKTGVVLEAVNLRWNNVPLAKLLKEKLAPGGGVVVENDVNAAIYGEWKLGAAKGATDALGVWVGTGIGGGLILNGALYAGGFFTAGEIGHTTLIPNAPLGRRSVEQNCSRTSVVERLSSLLKSNHKSVLTELTEGDFDDIRSKTIAAAYEKQDPLTVKVVDEMGSFLGTAIAGVVTLLSLPRVVLGGGFTEAVGETWVKHVRKVVRETVFPDRCRAVEVVASTLEDDAGLLGAALLARETLG